MLNARPRSKPRLSLFLVTLFVLIPHAALVADKAPVGTCRVLKSVGRSEASAPALSWISPTSDGDKSKLDAWCDTVGPALVRTPREHPIKRSGRTLIVDWNVNVGNGNIEALIQKLTADELNAGRPEPHFVFLLQEAFRRDPALPSPSVRGASIPSRIASPMQDIQALSQKLDWWMFYVPSMRNGKETEDRGNAILSTLPLENLSAIELPFSVQ